MEAVAGESEAVKAERLRSLARSGHDPILTIGFPYSQAVRAVAAEFPKVRFAIVDSREKMGPNVTNLVFNEQEAGYLAGAVAALTATKKTVGFIGAVKGEPEVERVVAGFAAGVKAVDADVRIATAYVSVAPDYSGYDDRGKAQALAGRLLRAGGEVIFQAADNSNQGITRAAHDAGALVIGADADESKGVDEELRQVFVTSIVKRIDIVVLDYLRSAAARPRPVRAEGVRRAGRRHRLSPDGHRAHRHQGPAGRDQAAGGRRRSLVAHVAENVAARTRAAVAGDRDCCGQAMARVAGGVSGRLR